MYNDRQQQQKLLRGYQTFEDEAAWDRDSNFSDWDRNYSQLNAVTKTKGGMSTVEGDWKRIPTTYLILFRVHRLTDDAKSRNGTIYGVKWKTNII